MQKELDLVRNDDLDRRIREATKDILEERGLSDRVKVSGVQPKLDSDRFAVGLTKHTGPKRAAYYSFYIEGVEVSTAVHGADITIEALKPFVRRELLKIFPE